MFPKINSDFRGEEFILGDLWDKKNMENDDTKDMRNDDYGGYNVASGKAKLVIYDDDGLSLNIQDGSSQTALVTSMFLAVLGLEHSELGLSSLWKSFLKINPQIRK